MANAGQEVRVGNDMHSEEEEYVNPSNGIGNNDEKVQKVNPNANNVAKGRNGPRIGNREEYYNESNCQAIPERQTDRISSGGVSKNLEDQRNPGQGISVGQREGPLFQ
ncbi:hypothetical protein ACSBR2_017112 [Camellia fascicularis]